MPWRETQEPISFSIMTPRSGYTARDKYLVLEPHYPGFKYQFTFTLQTVRTRSDDDLKKNCRTTLGSDFVGLFYTYHIPKTFAEVLTYNTYPAPTHPLYHWDQPLIRTQK